MISMAKSIMMLELELNSLAIKTFDYCSEIMKQSSDYTYNKAKGLKSNSYSEKYRYTL